MIPPCCHCFNLKVAGCASGMLGIGGGMVLGPMMLDMGMLPQVP
jgi:uncharacterized membrane protein YfcA